MMSSFRSYLVTSTVAGLALLAGCKFPDLPRIEEDAAPIDGRAQHQLAIIIDPASTGGGTVSVEPGGFTCTTGTCMRMYDAGTDLTITAAGTGSLDVLSVISGDCSASPCTIQALAEDRSVSARFDRFDCVPGVTSCTGGRYTECGSDGAFVSHVVPNGGGEGIPSTLEMNEYLCPMGCHATAPRCADVDTENTLVAALDSAEVSSDGVDVVIPAPGSPSGVVSIDANSFDMIAGEVRFNDTNGVTVSVPAQIVMQTAPAPAVLVLKTRTFTLRAGSSIRVDGPRALAIVSNFDIVVGGRLDLSALVDGGPPVGEGPGSLPTSAACAGQYLNGVTGGGSNGCLGGNGSNGASRGVAIGLGPSIVTGGCPGGRSTGMVDFGAGAGGGLALVSRTKVTLAAGSLIDLSGAGGRGTQNLAYGGGSGGRLVLQSPSVSVLPGAVVAARGGGGGAGGPASGVFGTEGPTTGTAGAPSVTCSGCGNGGAGGVEPNCGSVNGMGTGTALAGGGGGVGELRSFTRTGATSAPAGSLKLLLREHVLQPRSP